MRFAARVLLAGVLGMSMTGIARAEEPSKAPYELVRDLGALQDQTVLGDATAHARQRKLIIEIAERLVAFDASVWRDPRNVRAVVTYVLSGGEPRVLKALFSVRSLPGADEKLLNGALAYAEGRNADALELLSGIDARTLEANLGAHVALVQATLLASKEPKRSLVLLDDARLLAPGTVIEDSALRRQAFAAAAAGDVNAFESLSSQYLRRFPNSIYAGAFREQFAVEVASERYGQSEERLERLEGVLQGLDIASRRQCLLLIAQEAIARGLLEMAKFAGARAARILSPESPAYARARLYEAAALVVTDDYDRGFAMLQELDRSRLDARDASLADIALAVATEVRRTPETVDEAIAIPASAKESLSTLKAVQLARQALAKTEAILKETDK